MTTAVSGASERYEAGLTRLTHERMERFIHSSDEVKAITHQLASRECYAGFEQDEITLITKGLDEFVNVRLRAIGHALQHGAGVSLDDAVPEGTVFAHEPEVDKGDEADISGVCSIPIQTDEETWWLAICGYYLKTVVDGEEVIAQARNQNVAFPVAYALRESTTATRGLQEQRYFPYLGQTHYQGNEKAAQWSLVADYPALGSSVSDVARAVGGLFR